MFPVIRVLVVTALLAGCKDGNDGNDGYACTPSVEPGIRVEVRDDLTDEPLAALAFGEVVDGNYRDEFAVIGFEGSGSDPANALIMAAAYERPGMYDVSVQVDGYETWAANDIRVTDGVCHVNTVTLTARLFPLSE